MKGSELGLTGGELACGDQPMARYLLHSTRNKGESRYRSGRAKLVFPRFSHPSFLMG